MQGDGFGDRPVGWCVERDRGGDRGSVSGLGEGSGLDDSADVDDARPADFTPWANGDGVVQKGGVLNAIL